MKTIIIYCFGSKRAEWWTIIILHSGCEPDLAKYASLCMYAELHPVSYHVIISKLQTLYASETLAQVSIKKFKGGFLPNCVKMK